MEFVSELKKSVMRRGTERVIAILLSIVLTGGILANTYQYMEHQKQISTAENKVMKSADKTNKAASVVQAETVENNIIKEQERLTTEEEKIVEWTEAVKKAETIDVVEKEEVEINKSDIVIHDPIENGMVSDNSVENDTKPSGDVPETVTGTVTEIITDKNEITIESDTVMEEEIMTEDTVTDSVVDVEVPEKEPADVPVEMLSPFLIDEAGMIYGFLPEYADLSSGYLQLPSDNCVGIRKGTFAGCTEYIAEISIPAGMTEIEDGALTELLSLEWITVEAGNSNYIAIDGILFSNAGAHLSAYPPARVGAYMIPEGVVSVGDNAFQNTSLFMIDLRECGLSENCLLNISKSCSIIR